MILKNILLIFYKRGRERDRELEASMRERERHRSAASCTPPTGDVPATKVHALDQNQTWDLSVHKPMLYSLSTEPNELGPQTFFCSHLHRPYPNGVEKGLGREGWRNYLEDGIEVYVMR